MQIRGLMMDPVTNMPIIVLKDIGSDLVLPIWVNGAAHLVGLLASVFATTLMKWSWFL